MPTNEEKVTLPQEQSEPSGVILSLTPKQQRYVHLFMTGQYSLNKLAQLLEVHPNTLHAWNKRQDVKDAIAEVQESTHSMVATQLKNLTLQATDKLRELMNSPIDGVALQAVKDVLDRAGHKSKQEIKIDKTVTTIEEKFKSLVDSTIIDAEFEEVIEDGDS